MSAFTVNTNVTTKVVTANLQNTKQFSPIQTRAGLNPWR
jgi:hypothetical protein